MLNSKPFRQTLFCILLLVLSGCGEGEFPDIRPSRMLEIPKSYPGAGVRLEPPPAGATAAVTESEAFQSYVNKGIYPDADQLTSIPPSIQLALVSDDHLADEAADGSLTNPIKNELGWVIIFHQTSFEGFGGPPPPEVGTPLPEVNIPVDIVVSVDAATGEVISAFSDNLGAESGSGGTSSASTTNLAPDTKIVDPLVDSAARLAVVGFSGSDDHDEATSLKFECRFDQARFVPCEPAAIYARLKAGTHDVSVRAVDSSGAKDPSPATFSW